MAKNQKDKRNFRASKVWKLFRHEIFVLQHGIDPITKKKLLKGACLHHRNLSADDYECLDNKEDFVMLNKSTHDFLHDIYKYWSKDPDILIRIEEELKKWHK